MKFVSEPLIRYVGGKSWFRDSHGDALLRFHEKHGGLHVDPFLGGASIPLALGLGDMLVIGDACKPIAEMYHVARTDPGELAYQVAAIACGFGGQPGGLTKADYYRVRDWRPETPMKRAARMIYLARMGFRGVIRFNSKGNFNTPAGDQCLPFEDESYRKSVLEAAGRDALDKLFPNKEKFQDVAKAFKGAHLDPNGANFVDTVVAAHQKLAGDWRGSLLYLDPPYHGTFDTYSGKKFSDEDQTTVLRLAEDVASRGGWVIAHNEQTELIDSLWSDPAWTLIEKQERRSVRGKAKNKKPKAPCWIITNKPELLKDEEQ